MTTSHRATRSCWFRDGPKILPLRTLGAIRRLSCNAPDTGAHLVHDFFVGDARAAFQTLLNFGA